MNHKVWTWCEHPTLYPLKSRPFIGGTWVLHLSLELVGPHTFPLHFDFLGWLKWDILNVSTSHPVSGFHRTCAPCPCSLWKIDLLFPTGNGKLLNVLPGLHKSACFCARCVPQVVWDTLDPNTITSTACEGRLFHLPIPFYLVLISLSCFMKTKGLSYAGVLSRWENSWGCAAFKWPFYHVEFMKSWIFWISAIFLSSIHRNCYSPGTSTMLQAHKMYKVMKTPMKHLILQISKMYRQRSDFS